MNDDANIEESGGSSSAEFVLNSGGSRVDRRDCHCDGSPSRQLHHR
jgi:hypothetical protein